MRHAGVDDYRVCNLSSICCSAFNGVTHNNRITSHGLYSQDGVAQAFTFDNTGGGCSDVYYIGTQIFACQLEGCTGTCTGLIEQIDDRFTAQ